MAGESDTVLDYIDKIIIKGNPFSEPTNEYYALLYLKTGLIYLNGFAIKCNQLALQQIDPNQIYFSYGNDPQLKGIHYPLLECAFHWYSISACQYVRTIGAIAYRQDNSRRNAVEYLESTIPEVKAFRDKVAAHFAWLTKSEHDSEAERKYSVFPQVSFFDDSFQVGSMTLHLTSGGKSSSSEEISPWCITGVHKRLQERYWPAEIDT